MNNKPMGEYELRQRIIEAFDNIIAEDNKELQLQQEYHAGFCDGVRKLKNDLIKSLVWENKEKTNDNTAN